MDSDILCDSYYHSCYIIDKTINNSSIFEMNEGSIHQYYHVADIPYNYLENEMQEKVSKLSNEIKTCVDQILQPLIMELKTMYEKISANK